MTDSEGYNQFRSKDGLLIQVRKLEYNDTLRLVDIFERLSPESRYRRFNQTLENVAPNRIWQEAQNIAQADQEKSFGLLAYLDEPGHTQRPLGAARYVETSPHVAEVGISICDDFQNRGIGTGLMRFLALEARQKGYHTLIATIRNDNAPIWHVFRQLPFAVSRTLEGAYASVTIDLTAPQPAGNVLK